MNLPRIGLVVLLTAGLVAAGCADGPAAEQVDAPADSAEVAEVRTADIAYPNEPLAPVGEVEPGSLEARLRDASIATQVKMRLVQETSLRPYTFDVQSEAGQVTLEGRVASAELRTQAGELAGRVQGVREVRNRIEAPGAPPPTEESLAAEPEAGNAPAPSQADAAPATAASTAAAEEPSYHTVQNGESLWVIAQRYSLSIDELKELNQLRSNNLRPGQRLRVD